MKNQKTAQAANLYKLFAEIYSGEELDQVVKDALKAYKMIQYENDFETYDNH